MFYVHKMNIAQRYGGPEEGGWYYDQEWPIEVGDPEYEPPRPFANEEAAFFTCRLANQAERARREGEHQYGYTSVLSYREDFFVYTVTESFAPEPCPATRPHYE